MAEEIQTTSQDAQTQNTQTNDEVLEKYVAQRNRRTKIGISITLSVALLLVGALLFLSLWTTNLRPKFLSLGQPQQYEVVIGGTHETFDDQTEEYAQITDELSKVFKMPLLTALFTAQTGNFEDRFIEGATRNGGPIRFSATSITSSDYLGCSNYIRVSFADRQTILGSDGEPYDSYRGNEDLTFNEYYIALPEEDKFQDVVIVIPAYGNYMRNGTNDPTIAALTKLTLHLNVNPLRAAVEKMI